MRKKIGKIILYAFLIAYGLFAYTLLFLSIVPSHFKESEKKYVEILDNHFCYLNDYECRLYYLDKAKELVDTDPELYSRYSDVYLKKGDYINALKYAKIGVSNLKNREVYNSKYKILFLKSDVDLYENLAICYEKLGEYQNALDAYNYVFKKDKSRYSSKYLNRGRLYLQYGKYLEAKSDFIKHRDMINKYFDDVFNSDFPKSAYAFKDEDLIEINKLIIECDKGLSY